MTAAMTHTNTQHTQMEIGVSMEARLPSQIGLESRVEEELNGESSGRTRSWSAPLSVHFPSFCCAGLLSVCALFQPFQLPALVVSGQRIRDFFFLSSSLGSHLFLYCLLYTLYVGESYGHCPRTGEFFVLSTLATALPATLICISVGR